ncbi:MAG TPA: substrate-binding domain-containing protein, partial [Demequina sp.]|nr:substrate-binding domain-containing protein [Demequina sp.]
PDATLPDSAIVPVNRSDESGTTDNFTKYLAAAAPEAWTYEPDGVWPISGTQSGAQTSGVLEVVNGAEGTIAYVDASRAGTLGTVAVGVGDEFVPFSPEAAAKVLEVSSPTADATDLRLTFDLARDTAESGTYPVVLVSYLLACSQYDNEADAANVAAYLSYIASPEGQTLAASPEVAGIAPISDALRTQVDAAIAQITAG